MNYNDYDSNGNKKNFDFSKMLTEKQTKSRIILLAYLILIIGLIVMIRTSPKSTNKENNEEQKKDNNIVEENQIDAELKEMFSFIDGNNYEFKYTMTYGNDISVIEGKRYNKKVNFKLTENTNEPIEYIGTEDNILEIGNDSSSAASFNMFTSSFLKKVIKSSTIKDEIYEITNEDLNKLMSNHVKLKNKDDINTLELVMKNNKITEVHLDMSNLISDYTGEKTKALVVLEYYNFGLVDDFDINIDNLE